MRAKDQETYIRLWGTHPLARPIPSFPPPFLFLSREDILRRRNSYFLSVGVTSFATPDSKEHERGRIDLHRRGNENFQSPSILRPGEDQASNMDMKEGQRNGERNRCQPRLFLARNANAIPIQYGLNEETRMHSTAFVCRHCFR